MRFVTRERFRKGGIVTLVNLDGSLFPPADYISQFFADLVFSGVGGKVAVCAHRYSGDTDTGHKMQDTLTQEHKTRCKDETLSCE